MLRLCEARVVELDRQDLLVENFLVEEAPKLSVRLEM